MTPPRRKPPPPPNPRSASSFAATAEEYGPPCAANWGSLIELDTIDIRATYEKALISLASLQYYQDLDHGVVKKPGEQGGVQADLGEGGEGQDISDDNVVNGPDLSDPDDIITSIRQGKPPAWWPKKLNRLMVRIISRPHNGAAEIMGPQPVDPNRHDLGIGTFTTIVQTLLDSIGIPYRGVIKIEIVPGGVKSIIGGWRGEVMVGESLAPGSHGHHGMTPHEEYMAQLMKAKDEQMMAMFSQSSNVIHASAALVNAARGVNYSPPWMQGNQEENMPAWMRIAELAYDYITNRDKSPSEQAKKLLNHPIPSQGVWDPIRGYLPATSLDPQGPPRLGMDQPQAQATSDDWGSTVEEADAPVASEEWVVDEEAAPQDSYDPNPAPGGYDAPAPVVPGPLGPDPRFEPTGGLDVGGEALVDIDEVLANTTPEQLSRALERYIDQAPDKAAVRKLGMGLVKKFV